MGNSKVSCYSLGRYRLFLNVGAGLYSENYEEMKDDLVNFLSRNYKMIGRRKMEMIERDIELVDEIIKDKIDLEKKI